MLRETLLKFRLHLLGNALHNSRRLNKLQWLSYQDIRAFQVQQLIKLLNHAYRHVPFYRSALIDAGVVDKNDSVNLKRFPNIPLLDKFTLRNNFEDLKSDDLPVRKWYENSSGGSTGEPVRFIQDNTYSDWVEAIKIHYDSWLGCSLSSPRTVLWGSLRDLLVGSKKFTKSFVDWLSKDQWLNAFRMSSEQMSDYVKRLNSHKPIQVLGYVESIYEFARFIENENLEIHSPKSIMTSAGTLFPHMRETIERVFGAPVFNRYGSREVGDIACECNQHEGLHVCMPTHFVEIIGHDGGAAKPGELGEVIVTSLTNYAMPLIRYRIGDMAVWGEKQCTCGRTWPLLKEVVGRTTEVFRKDDGGIVPPQFITQLIHVELNNPILRKFQVIQEDYNRIRFLIVTSQLPVTLPSLDDLMHPICKKIQMVMGNSCRVEYEVVNDIPPSPSGKYLYIVSRLAQ